MYPKSRLLREQKGRRRGPLSSTEAPAICHCPSAVVRSFMKNRMKPNQLFGEMLSLRRYQHSRSFFRQTKHLSPTNCASSNPAVVGLGKESIVSPELSIREDKQVFMLIFVVLSECRVGI